MNSAYINTVWSQIMKTLPYIHSTVKIGGQLYIAMPFETQQFSPSIKIMQLTVAIHFTVYNVLHRFATEHSVMTGSRDQKAVHDCCRKLFQGMVVKETTRALPKGTDYYSNTSQMNAMALKLHVATALMDQNLSLPVQ